MADSEKLTINIGAVELGKIDVLVEEAVYQSRTDFIRTAIRNQLDKHGLELEHSMTRRAYVIGAITFGKNEFERRRAKGEKLAINVVGLLALADDISPELALDVVESVQVRGIFNAPRAVKEALASRTH